MADNLTLAILLKAYDQMSRVVSSAVGNAVADYAKLGEKVKAVSEGMQKVGTFSTGAGAVLTASMIKPIMAFSNLEEAITRAKVAYLTSTGVDKGFAEVGKMAEKLGGMLPGTTADFTGMASALKEYGLSTQTIAKGGLEASAYLRVLMGNLAPEAVAEMTATFKNSLGIAEKDFVSFVDLVQRQKFAYGVDPGEFAYTLKQAGAIGKQLGLVGMQGSKSLMGLTGMLSQAGIKGEQLGTSLRSILLSLPDLQSKIAKSAQASEILGRSGVHLEFFKNGQFLGIANFVAQLDKLKGLNIQDRLTLMKDLFGTESASALAEATSQGTKGYSKALDTLARQASLQARLNLIMGTFKNLWEAATGTLENTFAAFGGAMATDLKNAAVWFNDVSDKIGRFVQDHPRFARAIGIGTLAIGGLLTVGGGLLLVLGTMGKGLAFALGGVGKFHEVATKLAPTINRAATAVRGFVLNQRMMDAIAYRGGFWQAVQYQLMVTRYRLLASFGSWQAIRTTMLGAAGAARAFSLALLTNPITWIALGVGAAAFLIWKYWRPISGFFRGLWQGIREGAAPLAPVFRAIGISFAPIITPIKAVWGWLKALLKPVDDVGGGAEKLGVRFGKAIGQMLVTVFGLPGKLFAAGRTAIDMLWKGMQSVASKPIQTIMGIVQRIRNLLPFSPAKEGPLRDLHRIRLVETIAQSVRPAPLVAAMTQVAAQGRQAALPQMRGGMAAAGAAGGGGSMSLVYSPTIHLTGAGSTQEEDFMAILRQHKYEIEKMLQGVRQTRERSQY